MAKNPHRPVEGALESLAQAVIVGRIDLNSVVEWLPGVNAPLADLMRRHDLRCLMEGKMLTRRHFLRFSALTAAGYAIAAEPILAQAIRTDKVGLVAGDVSIKSGNDTITAYQAYPDKPGRYPVVVVISEIWGLH